MVSFPDRLSIVYVLLVIGLALLSLWPRVAGRPVPVKATGDSLPPVSQEARPVAAPGPQATGLVNLNTATQAELERLPGIGPTLAKRIMEGRPYASADDLLRVKGIGPRTLEKLKPLVAP